MTSSPDNTALPVASERGRWGWAFYDWANSAFATTVMAGFFPIFFKQYWNTGVAVSESTFRLGLVNSLASLVVVIMAPVLGAMADQLGRRKAMLLVFAFLGIVMTGGLHFVAAGNWQVAACLYGFALIGFSGSNLFYDSLLPFIARGSSRDRNSLDRISALGFALGYLGGGLLLALNILMTLHPDWFGLPGQTEAIQLSFLLVAGWWLLFSLPLMLWVDDPPVGKAVVAGRFVRSAFLRVAHTVTHIRELPNVGLFLLAYWIYIDGVDTIVRMAVDYGLTLGFGAQQLIVALLVTQLVGFPAALVFGRIGDRYGPKRGIYLALLVYMGIAVGGAAIRELEHFYYLAVAIGLVQGGIQALSRSFFARLVPLERSAEFFGFYNMLGKFAAVIGPVMMGWVGVVSGSPRMGILSLLLLFVAGFFVLSRVSDKS